MKKRFLTILIAFVMILSISVAAYAAVQVNTVIPSLSFNSSKAICKATVSGSGTINATLELWQNNTLVASWNKSGTTVVRFNESFDAVSGLSYTLTVSGTIGGNPINAVPVTQVCP